MERGGVARQKRQDDAEADAVGQTELEAETAAEAEAPLVVGGLTVDPLSRTVVLNVIDPL